MVLGYCGPIEGMCWVLLKPEMLIKKGCSKPIESRPIEFVVGFSLVKSQTGVQQVHPASILICGPAVEGKYHVLGLAGTLRAACALISE